MKNELRIGKEVLFKKKKIRQYLHVQCSFMSFRKTRKPSNTISNVKTLSGFNELNNEEKQLIKDLVDKQNVQVKDSSVALPKKIPTRKKTALPPSKIRTSKLVPSGLPSMDILFTNADHLNKEKMSELRQQINTMKPQVVAISEMKPKNNSKKLTAQDYAIPGYTLHPRNLEEDKGRGIAIYTHNAIDKSVHQIQLESRFEEACLLEIRLRGGDVLLFGCIYRSPTPSNSSVQNNEDLNNLLKIISKKEYSHRCIVGDFNYRDINWTNWTTQHGPESKEAKFIEGVRDNYLHQHIIEATQMRGNDDPSTLDLIFTDEAIQVSNIFHHAPLGKSDHSVVILKFQCYLEREI